jgi:phosphate transport system substrate-binding protein
MSSTPSRVPVKRLAIIIGVGASLCLLVYLSPAFFIEEEHEANAPRLRMGGTSGASFMIDKWKTVYRKEKGIALDYDSTGSTKGITEMTNGSYAIGFTHAPLSEKQAQEARDKGGEVLHVPTFFCAVVPVYNLKELNGRPPLNFTGAVLADIFRGKVTKWNDPALAALNEGVDLPDADITVVHREDSSGTTFVFAEYLHGASEAWRKEMGPPRSEVKWPVGQGMARNAGVAAYVGQQENTIGYVDLLYAYGGKLSYGAVQNKDRTAFIQAGPDTMLAAAGGLNDEVADDLTFNLTNKPGKDAYPIVGAVWAVCYRSQGGANAKMVPEFLRWATHEGQQFTRERTYAPLPEGLVRRVDEKLALFGTSP